jgi:ABC-type nitrate/sulfonate/bicarbonate transport system ATPase subunit
VTPAAIRTDTLLSIESVSLSYGDNVVLQDVNAKIDHLARPGVTSGQITAVLGPSGVGKTSLLRIIAGLQKPTTGDVYLGKDRVPAKAGDVGVVSQNYLLFRNRDVLSNLVIAARRYPDAKQRAVDMLNEFGLLDKSHLYPCQLSGGQRQRVAIAQQILSSDEFLLFDEPTAGLDPLAKAKVCDLISKLACRDDLETLLLVTHDIPSAVAVADMIWVMGREPGQPGARIVEQYDLVSRGLCWQPDIRRMPAFAETVEELQDRFKTL